MIRKLPSPIASHMRVIFELPACVWADRVFLVGDFNSWDKAATPFQQSRSGIWQVVLDLRKGRRYEFRYLVDGSWRTDYHADGFSENFYEEQNSVVDTSIPVAPAIDTVPTSIVHEGTLQHRANVITDYQPPIKEAA